VRVSAGTRFGELGGPLHDAGFALHNLGSLPHISIAGAVSTGTHGSGVGNGTLASAVSAVELVTADGDLRRLTRTDDPASFDGCVIALGGLGVVVALELDVQPTYQIRQYVYEGLPLPVLHDRFDEVLSAGYAVSVFTDWRSARADQVWRRLRVGPGETGEAPQEWLGATLADGPRHPIPGLPGSICTEQLGVAGPWHARLPYFRLEFTPSSGDEVQSEWFVAREDAVAALRALEPLRERIAAVLHMGEIRTIAADRLWLSPSAGRDTAALHFTWVKDEAAVAPVVAMIEERLAAFDARPHWGKVFTTPPEVVRERYERYADFEALLREHDPRGTFRNRMLHRSFPGADAA
jgi:xylitol oxidase